ncbi:MAG: hypothetical protein WA021_05940, partial [Minisyncoccia bacterium]
MDPQNQETKPSEGQTPPEQPIAAQLPNDPNAVVVIPPHSSEENKISPETPALSDGGASLATQFAENKEAVVLKAYGGLLLFAAVGGCIALAVAFTYSPEFTLEPHVQTAAAEAAQEPDFFADTEIESRAAYVYDVARQKELYAKNGHTQLPLASITKVILVLAVSEALSPEDIVVISQSAVEKGGGGLTWGEEWRVRD